MSAPPSDEAFARYASQAGLATADQLDEARALQADAQKKGQLLSLADALVLQGAITAAQKDIAEKKMQAQQAGGIKSLGNYKLLKKLGEGGMGAVYLAEDTNMLRKVALKVLPKKYASDPEFLTRFRREAKAAGKLNHVNIVSAFTVGEELGNHYYVMEYCEGEPLDKILKREGVLPWDKAVEVTMQIARGLQHAHQHGFIHRDIKPANVFIGSQAASSMSKGSLNGVAKILDMGLSKNISESDQSFNTQTGMALGTPHYISPEQARGEKSVDGRTDIYSLGATLYHLLTGQTPFTGSTAALIIMKHLTDQIPNPQDIREDIPDGVVMVVQKMMAKSADDRYPDCLALLEDLELVLDGKTPSSAEFDPGKSSVAMRQVKRIASNDAADRMRRGRTGQQQPVGTRPQIPVDDNRGGDRRQADRRSEPRGSNPNTKLYIAAGVAAMGVLVFLLAMTGGGKKPDGSGAAKVDVPKVVTPPDDPKLVVQPTPVMAVTAPPPTALLPGLIGTYYDGEELEKGKRLLQRMDSMVNFAWDTASPAPEIPADRFSARWDGFVLVKKPGKYTFQTLSDDGVRLLVDRNVLIDAWSVGNTPRHTADLELAAGPHAISLHYFEDKGSAYCHLSWSLAGKDGFPEQVIPPYALFHTPEQDGGAPIAALDAWVASVQKMTPDDQIKAVVAKLKDVNPEWNGPIYSSKVTYGVVYDFQISSVNLKDVSPIRAFPQLHFLACNAYRENKNGDLQDLRPLAGMKLFGLAVQRNPIRDFSPLKAMGLSQLYAGSTALDDLSVLSTFRDLTFLDVRQTQVKDFAPIRNLPIKELQLEFVPGRDSAILKSMPSLEKINDVPVAEFWAKNSAPKDPREVQVSAAILRSCVGTYEFTSTFTLNITLENGHLMSQATGQGKVEIFPASETEFFCKTEDASITFVRNNAGEVAQIVLHQNGDHIARKRDVARAISAPKKIDLLKLVDLQKDQVRGTWTKSDTALMSDTAGDFTPNGGGSRLQIPYEPPEEYDFKIVFTRVSGQHCAGQIFPAKGMQLACIYGGYANSVSGFELVNGEDAHGVRNSSSVRKPLWRQGQKHTALLEVRKEGTKAYFDGALLTQTPANYDGMSAPVWYKLPDARCLGVLSFASPTAFHELEVTEISGKGTFTRPNDPAAIEAERKRGEATTRILFENFDTLDLSHLGNLKVSTVTDLSIVEEAGHGKVLRINHGPSGTSELIFPLDAALVAGRTIRYSALVKCAKGFSPRQPPDNAGPKLLLRYNNATPTLRYSEADLTPHETEWHRISAQITFPPEAKNILVGLRVQDVAADVLFDDFSVEVDPAKP